MPRFPAPNFRCRVSEEGDENGNRFWRLAHANDENVVKGLLADQGLKIHSIESIDFAEWWRKRTSEEAASATAARKETLPWEFKPLWTELKGHLLDLFHHKCAYCEASFDHVAFGDVEHYRPKAKVTEDPKHLGYYWLAYEPTNYLPACQKCNQGRGKKNHFPIAGTRAYRPQDPLDTEDPLLLNPYVDLLKEHIKAKPSTDKEAGELRPITNKGRQSIDILDLNRVPLVRIRHQTQVSTRARIRTALAAEDRPMLDAILDEARCGKSAFSLTMMAEINDYYVSMGLQPALS